MKPVYQLLIVLFAPIMLHSQSIKSDFQYFATDLNGMLLQVELPFTDKQSNFSDSIQCFNSTFPSNNLIYSGTSIFRYDSLNRITELIQTAPDSVGITSNASRVQYTYTENGLIQSVSNQLWEANEWQEFSSSQYTYDEAGLQTEVLTSNAFGFSINIKVVSTYNPNGQIIEELTLTDLENTGDFFNSVRNVFSYSEQGLLQEALRESWLGSEWVSESRFINVYDSLGRRTERIAEDWNISNSTWQNSVRELFSYDIKDNLIEYINQAGISDTNTWTNNQRILYTINLSGQIEEEISQIWNTDSSAWQNSFRELLSFNSFGEEEISITQVWDTEALDWINNDRSSTMFNSDGDIEETQIEIWSNDDMLWNDDERCIYFYSSGSVAIHPNRQWNCTFANPLKNNAPIFCDNPSSGKGFKLQIINLQGQLVKEQSIRNNQLLELGEVPQGIYILKILSGTTLALRQKVIIESN